MSENNLIIYEGAMCCPTGVCGPEPDKELIEFNETLKRISNEFSDLKITRASLLFDVKMFLENKEIFQLVKENGKEILPITVVNGKIIAKKKYLKFNELKEELSKYINILL
ncbi:MAG: arsenite efflux transporter metallochaperone ArsD [Actinobacteria bacterium]|nr:arsenite efflux transporter metallochaperone ArsD [Actinomycetota bacterium]MCL6086961.1 arsenite efflux transporter metallochaperone ArsD [Actinomycetota bacterium]